MEADLLFETPPTDSPKTDNSCSVFLCYLSVFFHSCVSFLFFEFRIHIRNIGTLRDYKRAFFYFLKKPDFSPEKAYFSKNHDFKFVPSVQPTLIELRPSYYGIILPTR